MKKNSLQFGKSIDADAIVAFYFDIHKNVFNIVLESGLKVNSIQLTPQSMIDDGIINTDGLKKYLPNVKGD